MNIGIVTLQIYIANLHLTYLRSIVKDAWKQRLWDAKYIHFESYSTTLTVSDPKFIFKTIIKHKIPTLDRLTVVLKFRYPKFLKKSEKTTKINAASLCCSIKYQCEINLHFLMSKFNHL